ncbi:M3 family metallopeptidase, partial [candidate division KSB1 bacterium]
SYSPSGSGNPFFSEFDTPFGVPPFDDIREDHYMPAFTEGMKQQKEEVAAITGAVDGPTFENTIETLELSGKLLTNVSNVFYNMVSANTNDRLQDIAKEVAPLLSKHSDDILLDADLFKRVKAVYDMKDDIGPTVEQEKLLDETYKGFVRGGANLDTEDQEKLRKINEELSLLTVRFGENVLKEDNNFKLVIDREEDLAGLPGSVIAGAAEAARESGEEGKWVFTLHKPSMIPFLQYSGRRELREKIFRAYINRGNNDNEFDNKNIVSQIASLRVQKAGLLGYGSHAGYVLEENMAKTPENVYDLLNRLWKPALEMAKREADELQSMIDEEGKGFELQAWDWWYYAEKMRMEKYDLDEEALRPYFKLENVRDGAFMIANRLYGVTFEEMTDIPKYLDEVKTFEVKDADGSHLGIFYVDYFPRSSKRGGAWMNSFRKQSRPEGKEIHPVICNVCNFSKPAGDKPALLSFEEVRTLFHEFGHALHGLLANTTYNSLSGTSVPRDFVELPSQIMENWAAETEVLSTFAMHYETGETIPQDLIDKINNSRQFNQGFATVEYLAASFLDMDWHTLTGDGEQDVLEFETNSLKKIGLMPEIVVRYRSPYFNHIFSGGYASGYYSYIWAEVLDADAFEAFKENGLFDTATALAFRKNILERGGTEDPMTLYKRFRGSEPQIDALLKRRGLK